MQRFDNFIGGEWVSSSELVEDQNPSDLSDIVGLAAQADHAQLAQALASARTAFSHWANSGLEQRYALLSAIGEELKARAEELGKVLSREEGKPLNEGKGEVYRAGQFFTYYAAESLRQLGETADSVRAGIEIDIRREPLGVIAVISPWNFPIATAVWKIAPALAFGNAVVWKPASLTPASAWALAEIFSRQTALHDCPKGLLNVVNGSGSSLGQALAASAQIDALSFTGSVDVGASIARAAIANMTKIQLEMGSKNPLLVMEDADLNLAVAAAVASAFGGTGQKCTAASRLIVHEKIYDSFLEQALAATQALRVGHALEDKTQMGPVVSEAQLLANLDYVALAQREGCELACGGKRLTMPSEGFYMEPTLLVNANNAMRVNREEMFAPIACVIKATDYEEALAISNDTPFGLVSSIFTRSLARASHYRRCSRTGCVMVNLPSAGTDYHVPFGGRGISSYGPREQGRAAVEFYTQVKTSYLHSGAPE